MPEKQACVYNMALKRNWPQLRRAPNRIWSVNSNVCQHQYYDNNIFLVWTNIMSCHQQLCYLPIFYLCSLFAFLHGHVTAILTSRQWYASSTWTGVLFQLAVKSRPWFRCSPIHEEWVRCHSYPHVSTCQNIQTLSILDNLHT
jgi:hypothetical protein